MPLTCSKCSRCNNHVWFELKVAYVKFILTAHLKPPQLTKVLYTLANEVN